MNTVQIVHKMLFWIYFAAVKKEWHMVRGFFSNTLGLLGGVVIVSKEMDYLTCSL